MKLDDILSKKPFIIAEVGSNWRDFKDIKDSIQLAKNCGADAVKFQMFHWGELYGLPASEYGHEHDICINPGWLPQMKEKADAAGIELMITPFSVAGLEMVDKYVNIHKIASSDISFVPLLEAARNTGKPVLLSTGASNRPEMAEALNYLDRKNTIVLYCNSAYPSRYHDVRLMKHLEIFRTLVGYSDHSIDVVLAPELAKSLGAVVIEKHVDLIGVGKTPDSGHSLNRDEFVYMVQVLRGNRQSQLTVPDETDMILKHKRRLIVTRPIKKGDKFAYGKNFGIFRSLKEDTRGLSGFEYRRVNGKIASTDLKPGESIGAAQVYKKYASK